MNYYKGGNTKDFLIIHHTGSGKKTTFQNIVDYLTNNRYVSAHYVIGRKGEVKQLVNNNDRAWHAGRSEWKGITNLNNHSIGIEILSDGHTFTDEQRNAVLKLCRELMGKYSIPKENVLRHADIAPKRKWDVGTAFYMNTWGTWQGFQKVLDEEKQIIPDWAKEGIKWAKKEGISNCNNLFEPVTRMEMLVMLHRLSKQK